MKMDRLLKKSLVYAGIIVLFAILAYGFVPQVLGGKVVNQSDHSGWKGMTQEIAEHNAAHPDDKTHWTNSMFGGMPTVSMWDEFKGDWTQPVYKVLTSSMARPANFLFISLVGAFLMMLAFGISPLIAVAGAIAVTFCSYNLQIIQVGHNTKMLAIAFMPWVLAGLAFTYRSALQTAGGQQPEKGGWKAWLPRTVLGAVLFAFALSFQIKANHPQITYYLAIVIFIYAITIFIWLCASKDVNIAQRRKSAFSRFFAASFLLLTIGGIGIATNLNKLIPTYRYAEYTMRGGSELTPDSDSHNSRGLDLDYATAWSYGIEETPNLLIPNFNGGSSAGAIEPKKSETYDILKRAGQPNLKQVMKNLPLYWGPQPFTAGPMYMGAITIFLFVLGLALYRSKEKWWLLAATVIAVFLAWGSHFMWFTKLWFEYAPMYSKFRTVSMALVTLQVTLPLLGFIVLDRITRQDYRPEEVRRSSLTAYAVTAGFCLLCVLIPGIAGDFRGASDAGQPEILADALAADRRTLLIHDALRSLIMITLTAAVILWAYSFKGFFGKDRNGKPVSDGGFVQTGRLKIARAVIVLLVIFDLMPVDKRYLNKDHFTTKKDFSSQFAARPVDEIILEDETPDYRVLDISVNTFNDSHPSYRHKSIGGYSPAKLQRYQDLIDRYLSKEISSIYKVLGSAQTIQDVEESLPFLPVTSMLNGKYIIIGEDYSPVVNSNASGNCWFVYDCVKAASPDDEITLLGNTDLRKTAVIGSDFSRAAEKIDSLSRIARCDIAPADSIWMTHYAANELRYRCRLSSEQAAVFSEIYYPDGWKAWIEPEGEHGEVVKGHYRPSGKAQETELFRADWILRGAILPEGEYELVMRFEPDSYTIGENLSRASSILLILLLVCSSAGMIAVRASSRKDSMA